MKLKAALCLALLSPLIGEFLLGNLPVTMIWLLPILALLYGGGSLLIREIAVRFQLHWHGILLLCLAYGIIEEAFYTQSLFNPNYLGLRLLDYGYMPFGGISAWWTVYVIGIHIIWSTYVPISLIDFLFPQVKNKSLLGKKGVILVTVLFIGICLTPYLSTTSDSLVASGTQLVVSAIAVFIITAMALWLGRRQLTFFRSSAYFPSVRQVGGAAFILSALFMTLTHTISWMSATTNVILMMMIGAIAIGIFASWQSANSWMPKHKLSMLTGLLITYAIYGFVQQPTVGQTSLQTDILGNILFSSIIVIILLVSNRKMLTL